MYSMAQQAVPNGMGQSEFFRPQFASSLILVVMKPSPTADWVAIIYSFSSVAWVVGWIRLAKVIVIVQARLKSYRPDTGESNLRLFLKANRLRITFVARPSKGFARA
jgi:hypothetical protein